jgi:hypothetical protein
MVENIKRRDNVATREEGMATLALALMMLGAGLCGLW